MKKLIRNTSDLQSRAFWESVKKSAETLRGAPEWMQAGITLNDTHFTTFGPKPSDGFDSLAPSRSKRGQ